MKKFTAMMLVLAMIAVLLTGCGGDSGNKDSGNKDSSGDKKLTKSQIIKKAQQAFDKGQQALKDGDWTEYGKQQDKLQKYLEQLSK